MVFTFGVRWLKVSFYYLLSRCQEEVRRCTYTRLSGEHVVPTASEHLAVCGIAYVDCQRGSECDSGLDVLVKMAQEEKTERHVSLCSVFQIDALSKRSKESEAAFLNVYKRLIDAPGKPQPGSLGPRVPAESAY